QNMTHSFELWVAPVPLQMRVYGWIGQGDPAHNSTYEIMPGCQIQQPVSFTQSLPGLHRHYSIDVPGPHSMSKLRHQEISPNRLHSFRNPRIVGARVLPEMMV